MIFVVFSMAYTLSLFMLYIMQIEQVPVGLVYFAGAGA